MHYERSLVMFKTLDEVLAKRTQEDRTKIIAAGDKLAAKRDLAVKAATGGIKAVISEAKAPTHA